MKLAQKLVEVMKAVDSVPKNGRNDFHKYDYALEADIVRSVRGKLAELGVLVITSVESAQRQGDITEVFTKHTFIDAETGETHEVKWYGQGQDKGDKGAYKAETGSVKYMLLKTFLIPTGDDPEKEEPPPPKSNGQKPPEASPTPSGNTSTPEQQDKIRRMAKDLGLDINREILPKVRCRWPPDKPNAEKILARLTEMAAGK